MPRRRRAATSRTAVTTALILALAGVCAPSAALSWPTAAPAGITAAVSPPVAGPSAASADALPTAQLDGVAWTQLILGDTVYVGGEFTTARPAGAAAGTQTVARANVLAFNLLTGALTTFAPRTNGAVLALAASPDRSTLYLAGDFTTVNEQPRGHLAALNTADGTLVAGFAPTANRSARALTLSAGTLYVGGDFTTVNAVPRSRVAAVDAASGALLPFNPGADATVNAIVMAPDGGRLVLGGAFTSLAGAPAYGMGAVHPSTGAAVPWAATQVIRVAGANSAITHLAADADAVYGAGYTFGVGGNFEGAFSADPRTGVLNWMEDCHGDTYSVAPSNGNVFVVGHPHTCETVGGFPEVDPRVEHHGLAFTAAATGTLRVNTTGKLANFAGQPAPTLLNWYPDFARGSATGQAQGPWSVASDGRYVVTVGEFTKVNGVPQQGLARFPMTAVAPGAQGPRLAGPAMGLSALATAPGAVRVAWPSNIDRDDSALTYTLVRDGADPVFTTTRESNFFTRAGMGFVDTGLTPGSSHTYTLTVRDRHGNSASGSVTGVADGTPPGPYHQGVIADGAQLYWPLAEADGAVVRDWAGFDDGVAGAAVTRGAPGIMTGDLSASFDGTPASTLGSGARQVAPDVFTVEAWFSSVTTTGGKIVGFGDRAAGASAFNDRMIWMTDDGRISAGVYPATGRKVLTSPSTYNDGAWHLAALSLGPAGLQLTVDGRLVAQDTTAAGGQQYAGFWRVGGDSLTRWPTTPTSTGFAGQIDDVAVYPTQLAPTTLLRHHRLSGRASLPTRSRYERAVRADAPSRYWRLNETSGVLAQDASGRGANGSYLRGPLLGRAAANLQLGLSVGLDGGDDAIAARASEIATPQFSADLWFSTTSVRGGRLLGFGNRQEAASSQTDRLVWMTTAGRVYYAQRAGARWATVTSPTAYNDGRWHHLAVTQGPAGMALLLDGRLVGTHPSTSRPAWAGFWRVGGDGAVAGARSAGLSASLDEVAVYPRALTTAQVAAHAAAGR